MILGIIAARSTSHRLPGKSNMKIGDKTLLEHHIDGCLASKLVDRWVLATPHKDEISYPCEGKNIIQLKPDCNEEDVLRRYAMVVEHLENLHPNIGIQWIVRTTADCWDMKPYIIDKCVQWCKWSGMPIFNSYTEGSTVEIFTREDLMRADREHVGDIRQHVTEGFRKGWHKGSIDTMEELEVARKQYKGETI